MVEDTPQPDADPPVIEGHLPVLTRQVLELLSPKAGMVCLDCTAGLGGHGSEIVPLLAPGGRYIGLDVDPGNVELAKQRLAGAPVRVDVAHANFTQAKAALGTLGVDAVDLLLADLGFASNQMSDAARGLSFNAEGPLDMRLDPGQSLTAAQLVNELDEGALADLIYQHGQERFSRRIARKIVDERHRSPINTTSQLAQIVRRAYGHSKRGKTGGRHRRIDPATRTFMALRIAVNHELTSLEGLLGALPGLLRPGAVAAVISFHSLEDRLVKRAFVGLCRGGSAQKLTPKPLVADTDQRKTNPRSRSAKLRAIRWIG